MRLHYTLLVIWVLFYILTTILWIQKNDIPPAQDQSYYLQGSEQIYISFKSKNFQNFLKTVLSISPRKAPLIAYLPLPFYLVLGDSAKSALIVNIIFLLLFFVFFYLLVRKIYNTKIALVAILVTSTFPLFYGLSRELFVEFGLMTLVVIWLYILIKTKNFENNIYILILGIVTGFGFMMKFHFFIYVIGPSLLLIKSYLNLHHKIKTVLLKILTFSIPLFVITFPWYSRNILVVLWHAKKSTDPAQLGQYYYGSILSIQTIYLVLYDIVNFVISSYYFWLLIIFLMLFWYKREKITLNTFLFSWLIFPFLIFFIGPNRDYRFMLPLLPPVGIFIAWIYWKINEKKGFLFLPIILIFPISIYINFLFVDTNQISNLDIGPFIFFQKKLGNYVKKPENEQWPNEEILKYTDNLSPIKTKKTIILASENMYFNVNNLQYYGIKNNLNLIVKTASYYKKNTPDTEIQSQIESSDYLIMKVGDNPEPSDLNYRRDFVLKLVANWERVKNSFIFPDNGTLLIKKNPKIIQNYI